jgi:HEAT repeat protein
MLLTSENYKMVIDTFRHALSDPAPEVRARAAEAIAQIGERSLLPNLLAALHDQDAIVRRSVVWALSQFDDVQDSQDL